MENRTKKNRKMKINNFLADIHIILCLSAIIVVCMITTQSAFHYDDSKIPDGTINESSNACTTEISYTTCTKIMETTETTMTTSENAVNSSETITFTEVTDVTDTMSYLGSFAADYYSGNTVPCCGGSGRMLVSSYEKDDWYKGSVASRYIYEQYGYYLNEKTMVYCEFPDYPRLNGWYSVDDCNSDSGIFDFYYADYTTCPWQNDGVTKVEVWI